MEGLLLLLGLSVMELSGDVEVVGEAGMYAGAAQSEDVEVVGETGMYAGAAQRITFGLVSFASIVAPEVSESGIYAGSTQHSSLS